MSLIPKLISYINWQDSFGNKIPALCDKDFPIIGRTKDRVMDILKRKPQKISAQNQRKPWNKKYGSLYGKKRRDFSQKKQEITDKLLSQEYWEFWI
jgi:hypothetical protein